MPDDKLDVSTVIIEMFDDRLNQIKSDIDETEDHIQSIDDPQREAGRVSGRMEELEAIAEWFDGKEIVERDQEKIADRLEAALEDHRTEEIDD